MATFSTAQATIGLIASPTPEKQNSRLDGSCGVPQQTLNFGDKPIYCIGLEFGKVGEVFAFNPLTGIPTSITNPDVAEWENSLVSNPTDGTTFTIGSTVYTFRTSATLAGDVQIGGSITATRDNLLAEIVGSGIGPPHPDVEDVGFSTDGVRLVAYVAGTAGNAIAVASSDQSDWLNPSGFPDTLSGGSEGVQYAAYEITGKDCEGIPLPASGDNPAFLMTVSAGRVKATDGGDYSGKAAPVRAGSLGFVAFGADALSFAGQIVISCLEMPASGLAFATVQLLLEPS